MIRKVLIVSGDAEEYPISLGDIGTSIAADCHFIAVSVPGNGGYDILKDKISGSRQSGGLAGSYITSEELKKWLMV